MTTFLFAQKGIIEKVWPRKTKSFFVDFSRVFLLRQLWIVNYYVKGSLNNLSNENIKTLAFPEKLYFKNSSFWHFNFYLVLVTEII